jgi:hypothetical protein
MRLIDLIFQLLKAHVPMKEEEWGKLYREAEEDTLKWSEEDKGFKSLYVKANNKWYYKVGWAVTYIFATREIEKFMSPIKDENSGQEIGFD